MPNWCDNILEVWGDEKSLQEFVDLGVSNEDKKNKIWRMSNYHPIPEELINTSSPSAHSPWINEYQVNKITKEYQALFSQIDELSKNMPSLSDGEDKKIQRKIDKLKEKLPEIPQLIKCNNWDPQDRKNLIEKYQCDNWYDWALKNWGTKWDTQAEVVDFFPKSGNLILSFETAWSPPIEWLENVIKKFHNLKFKLVYMELGCWFCGVAYSNQGNLVHSMGEPSMDKPSNDWVWSNEKKLWISSSGEEITNEEYYENYSSTPENPFENFLAPWE